MAGPPPLALDLHQRPSDAEGRDAIETWLRALPVVITEADGEALDVDGTGDFAYVRGTYAMSMKVPNVAQPARQDGKFLQIYVRQHDGA
jgi:hypothetical protein